MTIDQIKQDEQAHAKLMTRCRALSRPRPVHLQYEEMRSLHRVPRQLLRIKSKPAKQSNN